MAEDVRFRLRRGTAAEWVWSNPILGPGEPGFEEDTRKLKVGDGWTKWNDLDYLAIDAPADGSSDAAVLAHINSATPHPVYDDGPSLELLYENAKV